MNLTIFQRMLIAPIVGMLLYGTYLYISYGEHRQAVRAIESIRDGYLPVMELTGENILLFEGMVTQLNDAVQAGEADWVVLTERNHKLILENLAAIEDYENVLTPGQVRKLREAFTRYYENAYTLSMLMLEQKEIGAELRNRLIANVEQYHSEVSRLFDQTRQDIQKQVHHSVTSTNQRLTNLLFVGVVIGILLLFFVTGLTFVLSLKTRKRLRIYVERMKDLAQGQPDFSKRLEQHSQDELGLMAGWFNHLSEKLEQDYLKIELLSVTDKLTQLYNRTKIDQLFENELKRAGRYAEGFSIILLDLDHFKAVNDTHGHQVGDKVLQELASILRTNVRETDAVGRWGGEEFIIISPQTTLASAEQLAEKLRSTIASFDFTVVSHKTASFGVTGYQAGDDEDSMTRRVDEYLYRAKELGRNRVIHDHSPDVP